jgi:hypothetical protein
MSRRKTLAESRQALDVRRVQEQAALLGLRRRQRIEIETQAQLDRLIGEHRDSETAWAAALEGRTVDIDVVRLWGVQTDAARGRVREGERALAEDRGAVAEHREAWETQLRLAEAADAVVRSAARDMRRTDDERRLLVAEDIVRARRRST